MNYGDFTNPKGGYNSPNIKTISNPLGIGLELKLTEVQKLITGGKTVQDRVVKLSTGIKEGDYITSETLKAITNLSKVVENEKKDLTRARNIID